MSEYIIDTEKINELNRGNVTSWLSPYAISDTSGFPPRIKETHFAVTLPEIVRCRDCEHFTSKGTYKFENGKVNADYCDYVRGWVLQITPDGFCAWGERRGA